MNLEKELYSGITDGVAHARRTAWEEGLRQAGIEGGVEAHKARLSFQYLPDGSSMLWMDSNVPVCFIGPLCLKAFPTRVSFQVVYAQEAASAFFLQGLAFQPRRK